LYTAGDEEVISSSFMKKIAKHLNDNRKEREYSICLFNLVIANDRVTISIAAPGNLLMDTKYNFALTIPYSPTDIDLRRVSLPPALLKKGMGTVMTKV
jgi:hypothetical protein